jgi:hypothetical protein
MTASSGIRARRSDAGQVRVTQRDVAVLRWLSEMYGAPLSVVAELYGVGQRDTRRHAARLEQAGFASRQHAPAGVWLVPTRKGLRYAGLEYEMWSLVGWKADHLAAVCRMRLALERQYPGAGWESERAYRERWHGTGPECGSRMASWGSRAGASPSRWNFTARRPIGTRAFWPTWIWRSRRSGGSSAAVMWPGCVGCWPTFPARLPSRCTSCPRGWPGEPAAGGAGAPPGLRPVPGAFLLSPLALVCWAAAQGVLKVTGWPRWRVGAAAVAGGAAVIWLQGGPVPALAAHFSGFLGLLS